MQRIQLMQLQKQVKRTHNKTQEAETHTTIFKLQQVLSNKKTYRIAIHCFEI